MSVADTKFELCHDVEKVLQIGRDFQKQDSWRGAHHDTAKLLCDTIEYLRDRLNTPAGNAAAMREALVWLQKTGHRTPEGGWMCITLKMAQKDGMPYPIEVPPYAEDVITAALAKPPRNCDVGTAEEQLDRYGVYCQNRCTSCDNRHYCRICGERYRMKCMMEWAQMPYAAQEGCAK